MMAALRLLAVWPMQRCGRRFNFNQMKGFSMSTDVDEGESQPDVWGADTAVSIADLAAALPRQLAPAIDAAHELGQRITPAAIGSARHSHRVSEARNALQLATNTLSDAVNQFKLVDELLKGLTNV
jgi:hypothetical protein